MGTMVRVTLLTALLCATPILVSGCSRPAGPEVVVYTSVDEPFARPILRAFTEQTGIRVRAAFDTEAAKTVGLAQRLRSERNDPRCDVFWSNEILQTLVLKEKGLLAPYISPEASHVPPEFRDPAGYYTGHGGRLRVLLVRPSACGGAVPRRVNDLIVSRYAGQAAMARPIAGTTLTHTAALCLLLGMERAEEFFERIFRNDVQVVDGNARAKDLVVGKGAAFCLTDTDDALKGVKEDPELAVVIPDQEPDGIGVFLIPGTVALIKNGPHSAEARALIDFLLSRGVVERMVRCGAFQVPLRRDVTPHDGSYCLDQIRCVRLDWSELLALFPAAQKLLMKIFLR